MKLPKRTIADYLKGLEKEISLGGVLLFGSYAYGRPTADSDLDLAIISRDFNKMKFTERIYFLQSQRSGAALDVAMDIIGYTPREFKDIEKHSSVMAYAKKHGRWLKRNG